MICLFSNVYFMKDRLALLEGEDLSWRDLTAQQFSFLIFVLVVGLSLDTAFAFLTNTLWVIGIATPYLLATPVWYYIDARVKRKCLVQLIWVFFFSISQ